MRGMVLGLFINLYEMAFRAAVFASARPYHHPIIRNDIIPTPSQPMKSCNRLLAVLKMTMVIKNHNRYLINRSSFGSEYVSYREFNN